MTRFLIAFVAVLLTLLAMEAVWFSIVVERVYRPELGDLLADEVRPVPALLFYLIYPAALVILAVRPFEAHRGAVKSGLLGVVVGLAAYGAYDLTNLATVAGWSELVTVVDLIWGSVLSGSGAFVGSAVIGRFLRPVTPDGAGPG